MPTVTEAEVTPGLLTWARKSIGLTIEQAAEAATVKPQHLQAWESGAAKPSVPQIRKLGKVYRRPIAVFFLPTPPEEFQVVRDFRRHPADAPEPFSRELQIEIRRAEEQREDALELHDLLRTTATSGLEGVSLPPDPEKAGAVLRQRLGITAADQQATTDQYEALGLWVEATEHLGVLVFHASRIDVEEMRGLSIWSEVLPVILLNGADSPRARVFTTLHELAHLAQRASGVCDLSDSGDEQYCNAVAAAILMPRAEFEAEPEVRDAPARYEGWEQRTLRSLAARYTTSQEAVVRRLLTIGKTTPQFYRQFRAATLSELRAAREEMAGGDYYRTQIRNLGRSFVDLAFNAYEAQAINISDLSGMLNVKVGNIPRLRDTLQQGAA